MTDPKNLMNRLKRIEGQVRGVEGMLENEDSCVDILMQVSAINCALNSFNKVLIADYLQGAVAEELRDGKTESVNELVAMIQKLMK